MNTQLIDSLKAKATKTETHYAGISSYAVSEFDKDLFATLIIEEAIALLKKGDPDFNSFSERLVRNHFGVR